MAAAIGNALFAPTIEFSSVGVWATEINPFAVAIMWEDGIDISEHQPRNFADLEDSPCDLIISLTPEAQHHAIELTRQEHCEAEYWATQDPSLVHGSRETILESFRNIKGILTEKIDRRLGAPK
jgi:protein-tyrosine-phosphatase